MKKMIYYSLLTVTVVIVLYLVAAALYVPFNPAFDESDGLPFSAPLSAFSAIRLLFVGPVCLLSGLIMRYLGYDGQKDC